MVIDLRHELLAIVDLLERTGIAYALCGGLAVAVHGHARATQDLDVLIQPSDAPRVEALLEPLGFTLSAGVITFDLGTPAERHVLRISKAMGEELLTLDLLLVTPALTDVWNTREQLILGGNAVQVVSRAGLIAMKRLAGRPQDLADIAQLEEPR